MKKFFLFCISFAIAFAEDLTLGVGGYFQTQPYKGVSSFVIPSPVIFYDNGLVYARWTRVGVYFYGHKASDMSGDLSWGFSLTAQPRPNGYKPSDSQALHGLDEKKSSFEGGVAFTLYGNDKYFEAMIVHDLLGYYKSYIVKAELGTKYTLAKATFYPSVIGVYESKDFLRYYYGISKSEAAKTSYDTYLPHGGVRFAAQTYIKYPLYKEWSFFGNLRVDYLAKEARESPIVEDSLVYSGLASIIYTFK